MKTDRSDLHALLEKHMDKDQQLVYKQLEEPNVWQQYIGLFRGKNKWLMLYANFWVFLGLGLFTYSLVQFFLVTDTKDLLLWGLSSLLWIFLVAFVKLYMWLQMDKNHILGRLRQLEIQLTLLLEEELSD
ncbi:MAG: hypothetical protein OIF50_12015 [Flavobacteriaceae bacterium]|nr:hypothetical protein [Flavobacteriaceae bacterium]